MLAQVKEFGLTETRLTVPQLSEPDWNTLFGTIEAAPEPLSGTLMFMQAIVGFSVSTTVTVNMQESEPQLLLGVAVTVVVSTGNAVPEFCGYVMDGVGVGC